MIINLDLSLSIPQTCVCIFTVKSLIIYYTDQNTPVCTCLLDASKDFDRVNHWTFFAKLIDTHAPLLIVRVLSFGIKCSKSALNGENFTRIILPFATVYVRAEAIYFI